MSSPSGMTCKELDHREEKLSTNKNHNGNLHKQQPRFPPFRHVVLLGEPGKQRLSHLIRVSPSSLMPKFCQRRP
jgi:hypothetical protein